MDFQKMRRSSAGIPLGETREVAVRALIDTNIFLDVLMSRKGLMSESQSVLDWCQDNPVNAWIAWHTLSNLYYVGAKTVSPKEAENQIGLILEIFEVSPTDTIAAIAARKFKMKDFEDALQAAAAANCNADVIVTRNIADFKKSPVKAVAPGKFLLSVRS